MAKRIAAIGTLAACATWGSDGASAQDQVQAGRALALQACTGCHVVAPDQPFKPVYTGVPHPPDFQEIANRSDATADSLRRHLSALPAVPEDLHMANPILSSQQLRDVVAFIISLRGNR